MQKKFRNLGAAILTILFCTAGPVLGATWINPAGGSWPNPANWSGGIVPGASGDTADFSTLSLGSAPLVTLDGATAVGSLVFGDVGNSFGWTLAPGSGDPLTLDVLSGSPTITVNKTGPSTVTEGSTATYNFTIRLTDSALQTTTKDFTIVVYAPLAITTSVLADTPPRRLSTVRAAPATPPVPSGRGAAW